MRTIDLLLLYATNKRDLLFLVANDDLHNALIKSQVYVNRQRSLIEGTMAISLVHFCEFGRRRETFRLVLREMLFYNSSDQAALALATREGLVKLISELVREAKRRGDLASDQPSKQLAWLLFSILQAEIRRWLAFENPVMREAIDHLWGSLSVVVNGMSKEHIREVLDSSDRNRWLAFTKTL